MLENNFLLISLGEEINHTMELVEEESYRIVGFFQKNTLFLDNLRVKNYGF